ncbi:hypothetical protein N8I71_19440 [Roseibacterium sp. SDUM158016]|uniref:hypothetical protein n=1 Tax=Roseicyclus sediminis TaxID=2980997 RepID=UPI0021D2E602|nr:hypothetical protein [Roseibacterium sp. SDUM158016]MCU4655020.1 hypothetical protein [Roseibacterium sp. SDUM158016]
MAIGLVFLAGFIALPVALGAWILGGATFVGAVLIYVGTGWAVLSAGMLSSILASVFARSNAMPHEPAHVAMKVKVVDRG